MYPLLLLISAILSLGYVIYIKVLYEVDSISESYYKLGPHVFLGWTIMTSLTLLPAWLSLSPSFLQPLPGLSASFLVCAGIWADFEGSHRWLHNILAGCCFLAALVWISLKGLWMITALILLVIAALILFRRSDWLWWGELVGLGLTYISIII